MEKFRAFCIICAILWFFCLGGCAAAFLLISPGMYPEWYENACWTIAFIAPIGVSAIEIYGDNE